MSREFVLVWFEHSPNTLHYPPSTSVYHCQLYVHDKLAIFLC